MNYPSLEQIRQLGDPYRANIPPEFLDHNGHMNVKWYFHLFDQAGWHFFVPLGIDENYTTREKKGIFALQQHIRYLAEVHQGEAVAIYFRAIAYNQKRLHYLGLMVNDSTGQLAAIFEEIDTHADLTARKSIPWTAEIQAKIAATTDQHQTLDWAPPLCGALQVSATRP